MQPSRQRAARLIGGIDPWLTLAFLALMCVGVLMVYSASVASAYDNYDSPYYYIQREIVWVVIGCAVMATISRIDYRRWQPLAMPLFVGAFLLLALVMVPHIGHVSHGARRWFSIGGGISIQPSEMVKLTGILYLATWFTSKGERVSDLQACFVPFGCIVATIAAFIIKEPDLGTAIVVTSTFFAMFYVAGANVKHLAAATTGAGLFAWTFAHSASYRFDRLMAFMDPWKVASGVGYHTVQALLALGSGGIFGVGLGNGVQKHVLPAPHTDSILAVIGEEWGLMGTAGVLILFMVIAYRGMRITVSAPDNFARLVAAGITSWITIQALLNFAVITSSVPFTGVPLPFISYGGTSLVITMAALGILLNISRHTSGEGFARRSTYHGRRNRRPRLSGARDLAGAPSGEHRKGAVRAIPPRSSGRSQARHPG